MTFNELKEYQPDAVNLLKRAVESNRLSHALIFASPGEVGEIALAMRLSQFLLCESPVSSLEPCGKCKSCKLFLENGHPDFHEVKPKGLLRAIKTSDMLAMIKSLQNTSHSGYGKVVIIHQAETLRKESANRFLKTLEEPTAKTYFILLTSRVERLLPTIKSRCQIFRMKPFSDEVLLKKAEKELKISGENLELVCLLASGRWRRAVQLSKNIDKYKELVKRLAEILSERDNATSSAVIFAKSILKEKKDDRKKFEEKSKKEISAKKKELSDLDPTVRKEIIAEFEMQLKSEQGAIERDDKAGLFEAMDALWRDVLTYKATEDADLLLHKFMKSAIVKLAGKYSEDEVIRNLNNINVVRGPTVYLNTRLDIILQGLLSQAASKSAEFTPLRAAIVATGL